MMSHVSKETDTPDEPLLDDEVDGELAEILADPYCWYLVKYLQENENYASVGTIAKYVVAEITDTSPDDVSMDVRRRVQTWLHHGQLPELDAYGVVEFDPESSTVRLAAKQR